MGGPAVGGAPGQALPDLIVLEVGVAEVPQGRPEGARGRWHACSGPWCHPWRCGRVYAAGWRVWPPQRDRAPWADCGLGGARADARFVRQVRALTGPHTVEVNGDRLQADEIFINVGARAAVPDMPGVRDVPFLTNTGILDLDVVPEHGVVA